MCGLVGFWNFNGRPAENETLARMLQEMRYRGPDDQGVWTEGPVGLGQCRLSILDLSPRGHQPFVTADGQGVLTYNGEVYNFRDLRRELESEGVRFASTSDTEVILYALHRWGPEKAIPRFNGMFALGYFDRRDQTLWLTRDRLGIKPLYWIRNSTSVLFSSEIKALLAHPEVDCRPDLQALCEQMLFKRLEGERTPFEKIQAVRPGTIVRICADRIQSSTYFDVALDFQVERILEAAHQDPAQWVREFESAFAQSVGIHLISDAPLAAMCSGGLDSSLMTAVAKELIPNLVVYVADVKGALSEGAKAHRVGKHLGIEVRQVDVDRELIFRLWPMSIWHNDQPTFHPHDMPFMAVAEASRRDGIKVLLTGEGSDEMFGGYPWQSDTYRMWRIRQLHLSLFPNIPLFRGLGRWIPPLAPLNLSRMEKSPFTHLAELEEPEKLIREAAATDGGRRLSRHAFLFQKLEPIRPLEDRAFLARCLDDLTSYLQTLLHRNDRMGMAASIEARVPFLENQMIDFAMHLPRRAKFHKGITKWVVKTAAEKRLPREIIHAPKLGFAVEQQVWPQAASMLLRPGVVPDLFGWDGKAKEVLLDRILEDPYLSLTVVGIELWARIFLRGESPQELGEKMLALHRNGTGIHAEVR